MQFYMGRMLCGRLPLLAVSGVFALGIAGLTPAATISFKNTGPGTAADLNGIGDNYSGGLSGFNDVPVAVSVSEVPGLSLTVTAVDGFNNAGVSSGAGLDVFTDSSGLGVDAFGTTNSGADNPSLFDSNISGNESITLKFNQAVKITQIDFDVFDPGDAFLFGAVTINSSDLNDLVDDVYDNASGIFIAANTEFTIGADTGGVRIESLDLVVVPEPTAISLAAVGAGVLFWRRSRHRG